MPRLGTSGSVPPNTLYTFLAWTRDTFLFTVTFIWRARRVVENDFGNLASRFWVYAKSVGVQLRATDVTIFFLCSHNWLQIISRHCLQTGTVDMEELTWQMFNLDHGAGNEVDGLPSANNAIQLSVKSSGRHKISACWLLRRERFVSMTKRSGEDAVFWHVTMYSLVKTYRRLVYPAAPILWR